MTNEGKATVVTYRFMKKNYTPYEIISKEESKEELEENRPYPSGASKEASFSLDSQPRSQERSGSEEGPYRPEEFKRSQEEGSKSEEGPFEPRA